MNEPANPWKLATIGILLVGASAGATMLFMERDAKTELSDSAIISETQVPAIDEKKETGKKAAASHTPVARSSRATSSTAYQQPVRSIPQSVIEACNRYANERVNSKTEEVFKNAVLGAAIGAAVGAAGGAIAGGGKGAGKGAAIGGVTGAAGGTLYGLNESQAHDSQYQAAYSSCMSSKGF